MVAFSQANVARPRTGSPVVPGGAAIPGAQAVPNPDPADPTPDPVPGLELLEPADPDADAPAPATRENSRQPVRRERSVAQADRVVNLQGLMISQLQISSLSAIELNQFAAERTNNSEVREFAEALVSDQQHFWRALERLSDSAQVQDTQPEAAEAATDDAPSNDTFGRPSLTEAEQDMPTQLGRTLPVERQVGQSPIGQTLPDQFPLSRRPPAQSLTPPADGDVRYGGTLPPAGGETRVRDDEVNDVPERVADDRVRPEPTADSSSLQMQQSLSRLITIADRAAQYQFVLSKELLERYDGDQFDKGFVAMQVAEQARALAHLRAVKENGSQQFREIIQTAEELTQSHLESAVTLSQRLHTEKSDDES